MLPSQLLRARFRRSELIPLWVKGNREELDLAKELSKAFVLGKKLREIREMLEEIEETYEILGTDYKLIRGLSLILERDSVFERPDTPVDPEKAREVVFRLVNAKYGGFITEELRDQVIEEAASELGITKEELEKSLWGDSDEFQVLVEAPNYSPEELLRKYNLSLLQTSLFRALNLRIETRAAGWEMKDFMRALKRLGLMYTAERLFKGILVEVSGPATVLKMTTRYGTSLAKLMPYLVALSDWRMEANIRRGRRILRLRLDSSASQLFPRLMPREPEYDSSLERRFASIAEAGGWKTFREPEPLVAGRSIVIPDFLLVKGVARVYVEVMGFWTPEYVERKLDKIAQLREPILVVARKDLLCSRVESLPKDIFYIDGKLDKVALLKKLDEIERRTAGSMVLRDSELSGDVIDLRILARKKGMRFEQLKSSLSLSNYILLGDYAVRKEVIGSLRWRMIPRTVGELKELLRESGLPEDLAVPLASALGYEVIWHGLDEDEAELSLS